MGAEKILLARNEHEPSLVEYCTVVLEIVNLEIILWSHQLLTLIYFILNRTKHVSE